MGGGTGVVSIVGSRTGDIFAIKDKKLFQVVQAFG
jgi:hypothetical protein